MERLRILLADDHPVVVQGLRVLLMRPELEIVGTVTDGREMLRAAAELQPDIIVADIAMPSLNGIEAMRQLQKQGGKSKVIFLTMHTEPVYAAEALKAGAYGYVPKSAAGDELLTAIQRVAGGGVYVAKGMAGAVERALQYRANDESNPRDRLTERQREVLQMLAEGRQTKEIAATLKVSRKTVEFHKYRIMDVLGIRSVAELARYAARHGFVP